MTDGKLSTKFATRLATKFILIRATMAAGVWLLGAGAMGATNSPAFTVPYFPAAGYLGERMTFVVGAGTGEVVRADVEGVELKKTELESEQAEMDLTFHKPGMLNFRTLAAEISFHLVMPDEKATLREEMGYLYTERGPAILMARHLHPPKHDRRWETLRFIRSFFCDSRPTVRSGVVLHGPDLRTDGFEAGEGTMWSLASAGRCLSELSGFLTGTNALPKADALVLALSGEDLEQGMDFLEFRIKLEWYLQRLRPQGFRHIFVTLPALRRDQQERFAGVLALLPNAAKGNGAVYVACPAWAKATRPSGFYEWFEPVERAIRREVKLGK